MENTINKRIRTIIKNEKISQERFCEIVGMSIFTLRSAFQRGANPGFELLYGIASKFPAYSLDWLIAGNGTMMKTDGSFHATVSGANRGVNVGQMSGGEFHHNDSKAVNGTVGQINGGVYNIHTGSPEGAAAEVHKEQVEKSFGMLRVELARFHEKLDQKDKYISRVLEKSFNRNEENMKRIDGLLRIIADQSRALQEMADKIVGTERK